jgi:ribosome-binding protein aMBF1 (putative translation factor)
VTQKGKKNVKFSRAKRRRKKTRESFLIIRTEKQNDNKLKKNQSFSFNFAQTIERERGTEGISKEFLDSEKDKVIP